MNQPIFWGALLATALLAAVVRLRVGRPLLARHATPVGRRELFAAGLSGLVLVFHCAAMFFAPWVEAIPGAHAAAEMVRAMGTGSQWAYWLPAAVLAAAWRRIWWPGLALLVTTLFGVGVTMYWPHALATHLTWLAALILVGVFISTALLSRYPSPDIRPQQSPAHTR